MAAEAEANLLLAKLLSNPVMGEDGLALFHATHGNLAAGAALDVAALDAARKAMRGMKALDGKTPINDTPKYLLVGPELETTAVQVLASIYAATVADVNAFSGKLSLLVEPRITDESFYVFADPAGCPCWNTVISRLPKARKWPAGKAGTCWTWSSALCWTSVAPLSIGAALTGIRGPKPWPCRFPN